MSYTKGPWEKLTYTIHAKSGKSESYDILIADTSSEENDMSHSECEANANLIAAAPELLEIAKLILSEWEKPTEGVQKGELIARLSQYAIFARAVIKKAKGTQ